MVGDGPAILRRTAEGVWTHTPRPDGSDGALRAISGRPSGPIVAAGDGGEALVLREGSWERSLAGAQDLSAALVTEDGSAYVAGRDGELHMRPPGGAQWVDQDLRRVDHIRALAHAGGELWALGQFGVALRRTANDDGVATWEPTDTDTSRPLAAAWAPGDGSLFAAGLEGAFLRWDGQAWSDLDSPFGAYFRALWGRSSNDVYAAGWDGAGMHWDGERF